MKQSIITAILFTVFCGILHAEDAKRSVVISTIPNISVSNFNKERIRKIISDVIESNGSLIPVFEERLTKASLLNYQKEIQKNVEHKIKSFLDKAKENYYNYLFDASMEEITKAKEAFETGKYYLTDNKLLLEIYLYETLNQIALNSQGIQIYFKDLLKLNKDLALTLDLVSPKVIEEFEVYKRKVFSSDSLLKLNFKIIPKDAKVFINTSLTTFNKDIFVSLIPGDHYIVVKKDGYLGYAETITLDQDKTAEINLPKMNNATFIGPPKDFPQNDIIDYFKALEKENKTIINEVLLVNLEYTNKRYQLVTKLIKLDESKILDTKVSEIGIDLKLPNEHIKSHMLSLYPMPVKEEPKVQTTVVPLPAPAAVPEQKGEAQKPGVEIQSDNKTATTPQAQSATKAAGQ